MSHGVQVLGWFSDAMTRACARTLRDALDLARCQQAAELGFPTPFGSRNSAAAGNNSSLEAM